MVNDIFRAGTTATLSPLGELDRCVAVPQLVGDPNDFLIIAGLAGTAKDTAHLCEPHANYYACAGVMGGATAMGLGLALSQPTRRVLVITGDGELLMNVGSLATVAIMNPPNLSILCVDNGHYGETGYQKSYNIAGCKSRVHGSRSRYYGRTDGDAGSRHRGSGYSHTANGWPRVRPPQGENRPTRRRCGVLWTRPGPNTAFGKRSLAWADGLVWRYVWTAVCHGQHTAGTADGVLC